MHIMFVCTGNICRSPMGELLLKRYLEGTSIGVSSAGTRGLPSQPMDPSSAQLLRAVGIDPDAFRSRRLTTDMANSADLILCFEQQQRESIVILAPSTVQYTFLLTDFANMSKYCAACGMVEGRTVQERLESIMRASTLIRPLLPAAPDIPDPVGQSFDKFEEAAKQTNRELRSILKALRKHSLVSSTPSGEIALA